MAGERKFPATERKKRKAWEDSDIPRSSLLTASVALTAGICSALFWPTEGLAELFQPLHQLGKIFSESKDFGGTFMITYLINGFCAGLWVVVRFAALGASAAVVAELAQRGFRLSFRKPQIKFELLSPSAGLKRLLGLSDEGNLSWFLRSLSGGAIRLILIFVLLILSAGAILLLLTKFYVSLGAWPENVWEDGPLHHFYKLGEALALISIVALGLGAIDLLISKIRWQRKLMMDLQELKREFRETEGDPQQQSLRRSMHQELALHAIVENVRNAGVVVIGEE